MFYIAGIDFKDGEGVADPDGGTKSQGLARSARPKEAHSRAGSSHPLHEGSAPGNGPLMEQWVTSPTDRRMRRWRIVVKSSG